MSHEFYRVVHLCGVMMLMSGLAALCGMCKQGMLPGRRGRLGLALIHGVGMLFLLVSGFAMLAELGFLVEIPAWAYIKFAVWLLLGGSMVLAKRKAHWGLGLIFFWILAATYAAYL